MKYYFLDNSPPEEDALSSTQLFCTSQAYAHQLSAWTFPNVTPILQFDLEKGAKQSDIMSDGSINGLGFIMNDKSKSIFEQFHVMKHQFYDVTIHQPNTGDQFFYHWLHLCDLELSKQIDYSMSMFIETEWGLDDVGPIEIKSFNHYLELKKKDHDGKFSVNIREIHLSDQFDKQLDLFALIPFETRLIASERLVHTIIKEEITGLSYTEIDHLYL